MRTVFKKGLLAAAVSAALFLGGVPDSGTSEDGMSAVGQAYAASGKGRGAGSGGGGHADSSHEGGSHSDSSHDDGHDDGHDDHDGGHDDDSHDSSEGKKGKGPRYQGGRTVGSKGKAGPGRTVVEKIFESE